MQWTISVYNFRQYGLCFAGYVHIRVSYRCLVSSYHMKRVPYGICNYACSLRSYDFNTSVCDMSLFIAVRPTAKYLFLVFLCVLHSTENCIKSFVYSYKILYRQNPMIELPVTHHRQPNYYPFLSNTTCYSIIINIDDYVSRLSTTWHRQTFL